jgi:hypothetical protein
MTDIVDKANDFIEEQINKTILKCKTAVPLHAARGVCLNCDQPLPLQRRWCNANCRDEYELTIV